MKQALKKGGRLFRRLFSPKRPPAGRRLKLLPRKSQGIQLAECEEEEHSRFDDGALGDGIIRFDVDEVF